MELNKLYIELGLTPEYIDKLTLPKHAETTNLVIAEQGRDGKDKLLTPEAAESWSRLKSKAQNDGYIFYIYSGFRSYKFQAQIIQDRIRRGETIEQATQRLTPPGFSEHHSGRAVDIACPAYPHLVQEFDTSAEFAWLAANANFFGFYLSYPKGNPFGIIYEPWHWFFR